MPFNKFPSIKVNTTAGCVVGYNAIGAEISKSIQDKSANTIVIECYQGVFVEDILVFIRKTFPQAHIVESASALKSESEIRRLTHSSVTDDRIFGFITNLELVDLFDNEKISGIRKWLSTNKQLTFVIGTGASLMLENPDLLIYADMARWEIQLRMRRNQIHNIGLINHNDPFETKYKRGYFLDWRLCDNVKKDIANKWNYVLDTNDRMHPKMISGLMFHEAMNQVVAQPFSVVPFFDPGPWGGQWMKEKFDLDRKAPNFAWGFNCVPEENSLLLDFNGVKFEMPSINVVFFKPKELLGEKVQQIFGDEFPIRFDFLDTIGGGNLSLQVHPLTEYIRKEFGMTYTQDESYYILEATKDAGVYLGLKENVDKDAMISDLVHAQENGNSFDADKYTQKWPAKKHDHFLIPAGTVHCSGSGCMVLEISATPYIFTFKLYDWGRLGLDGKPRPINIEHGAKVIQWDRQPEWTKQNLINNNEVITEEKDWREEQTGLHQLQFIETRRYWQTGKVTHQTGDGVNVLMIVEGEAGVVESPLDSFAPFHVNFGEAFIIPANINEYSIRPEKNDEEIVIVKAYVRT
jgi:mannose-6-phosphate isomerase class I